MRFTGRIITGSRQHPQRIWGGKTLRFSPEAVFVHRERKVLQGKANAPVLWDAAPSYPPRGRGAAPRHGGGLAASRGADGNCESSLQKNPPRGVSRKARGRS